MENDFDKWVEEWVNKLNLVKTMLIIMLAVILIVVIFVRLNEQQAKIDEIDSKIETILNDNKELWGNVDALSEDYVTLWTQLYGEDSWYETQEEKEKVHNEIKNMEE